MAIVNGIVAVFGAKPKLIKKKLFIGSIILILIVYNTKKTQAQVDCYKTSILKSDTSKIELIKENTPINKRDTVYTPTCYLGKHENPSYIVVGKRLA